MDVNYQAKLYQYALIDCPPNTAPLTRNALRACDRVLVTVTPNPLAFSGLERIIDLVGQVGSATRVESPAVDILACRVRRSRTSPSFLENLRTQFGDSVYEVTIRECETIDELAAAGRTAMAYDNRTQAARDYRDLAVQVLTRCQGGPDPSWRRGRQVAFRHGGESRSSVDSAH